MGVLRQPSSRAMRLHLLEHDSIDLGKTNIAIWAGRRRHLLAQTTVCNQEPLPSVDAFDWLVVMGGSPHAWDVGAHPWLPAEKHLIRSAVDAGKTVLGICFGAQLLAEALGERVHSNPQPEIGWHEVVLTPEGRESFLFRHLPDHFVTFHWHSDHFSLPAGCTRLAHSEATVTQAFVCGGPPLVGLQFHPEYTREIVIQAAHEEGHEWTPGPFVLGKDAVLRRAEGISDTYWLMEKILDNMVAEYG